MSEGIEMQPHPDDRPSKITTAVYQLLFKPVGETDRGDRPIGKDMPDAPIRSTRPAVPALSPQLLDEFGDELGLVPGLRSLLMRVVQGQEELVQALAAFERATESLKHLWVKLEGRLEQLGRENDELLEENDELRLDNELLVAEGDDLCRENERLRQELRQLRREMAALPRAAGEPAADADGGTSEEC